MLAIRRSDSSSKKILLSVAEPAEKAHPKLKLNIPYDMDAFEKSFGFAEE